MFFNVFLNDDDYVVVIVEIFRILKYANLSRSSNIQFNFLSRTIINLEPLLIITRFKSSCEHLWVFYRKKKEIGAQTLEYRILSKNILLVRRQLSFISIIAIAFHHPQFHYRIFANTLPQLPRINKLKEKENDEFGKRRKLKQVVRHRHLSSPKIQRPLESRSERIAREPTEIPLPFPLFFSTLCTETCTNHREI